MIVNNELHFVQSFVSMMTLSTLIVSDLFGSHQEELGVVVIMEILDGHDDARPISAPSSVLPSIRVELREV